MSNARKATPVPTRVRVGRSMLPSDAVSLGISGSHDPKNGSPGDAASIIAARDAAETAAANPNKPKSETPTRLPVDRHPLKHPMPKRGQHFDPRTLAAGAGMGALKGHLATMTEGEIAAVARASGLHLPRLTQNVEITREHLVDAVVSATARDLRNVNTRHHHALRAHEIANGKKQAGPAPLPGQGSAPLNWHAAAMRAGLSPSTANVPPAKSPKGRRR